MSESINNKELGDESIYPDDEVLKKVLGRSYTAYKKLLQLYDENEMVTTWRYYHDGKAWLCKVQKKKKTIVWMSAWKGFMKTTTYFPERYLDEIYTLKLKPETIEKIKQTKNAGKSKPIIFEVKNQKVLKDLNTIIQYKMGLK